jgi:hypothetical protein
MSFEGYYQVLCGRGHYHRADCYSWPHDERHPWACDSPVDGQPCGAPVGWDNLVDDTNCDAYGRVEMVQITDPVIKRCNLGHDHVWSAATYAPMTRGPLGILADVADDESNSVDV